MIVTKYPNREALYAAHTIYRDAMRAFIIRCLKKSCDTSPEELISKALNQLPRNLERPIRLDDEIESIAAIDIDNFSHLIRKYWNSPDLFCKEFNNRKAIWNETELIREGRHLWAHPGTKDSDPEEIRIQLHLIAKVLGKINEPEARREVEAIRDQLFSSHSNEPEARREVEAIRDQLFSSHSNEHIETTSNQLGTPGAERTVLNEHLVLTKEPLAVEETDEAATEEHLADISDELLDSEPMQKREEVLSTLEVGQRVTGVVEKIINSGAFVNLGGVNGLIPRSEMTWEHINHRSEVVSTGEKVEVKVIKVNPEDEKITLSLKRVMWDPWESVEEEYPIGLRVRGTISHIADHAVFLKLKEGVEGRIRKSDLSWGNSDVVPSRLVNQGDEIEAVVIDSPKVYEWIPLSIKSLQEDPWPLLDQKYPIGSKITGPVRNVSDSKVFVEVEPGFNGLLWTSRPELLSEGQEVEVIISRIDVEKQQISLNFSVKTDSSRHIQ